MRASLAVSSARRAKLGRRANLRVHLARLLRGPYAKSAIWARRRSARPPRPERLGRLAGARISGEAVPRLHPGTSRWSLSPGASTSTTGRPRVMATGMFRPGHRQNGPVRLGSPGISIRLQIVLGAGESSMILLGLN